MKIAIVGPKSVYPERDNVKLASKLICKKSLDYTYGKTIQVFLDGNQIGFVAAQNKTNLSGCKLAEEVFDDVSLSDTFEAIVVDKNGNSFEAEVKEVNSIVKEENTMKTTNTEATKKFKEVCFEVVGPKKVYPDRYTPIKMKRANAEIELPIRLVKDDDNDKIVVEFKNPDTGDWAAFGHINPEKSDNSNYKTDVEIRQLLKAY